MTDILVLLIKTKSEIREHLPIIDPHTGLSLQDATANNMTADKMIHHVLRRLSKNAFDHIVEYAKQIPSFSPAAAAQLIGEVQCLKIALSTPPLNPPVTNTPAFVQQLPRQPMTSPSTTLRPKGNVSPSPIEMGRTAVTPLESSSSPQPYFGQHCQEAITQLETMVKGKLTSSSTTTTITTDVMEESVSSLHEKMNELINQKLKAMSLLHLALITSNT